MAGVLTIHYGLPGTGKTLFAMNDVIIPAVREHRPFFTNITGISLSGLFAVTDVHQSDIRYYPVKDIGDVIRYFDDDKVCANGVFVLDEMKDFINDERAVSWLESRINVMRKQCVDFVLIAQLPEKEYIHPHIIKLADSCNVAVSRKKYNDTKHVDWYYVDGGMPRIVNKIPKNSAGKKIRKKPTEVFTCYKTSENSFYTGQEDETYRGLKWWQTRTAKLRFAVLGLFVVILLIFVMMAFKFKEFVNVGKESKQTSTLETEVQNGKKEERVQAPASVPAQVKNIEDIFGPSASCYKWKICRGTLCRTDAGVYTLPAVDSPSVRLCVGRRCVEPCADDNVLSSGR